MSASSLSATSGRARALDRITEHAKRFPDLVFARASSGEGGGRDAALERSIEQATLRHWSALRSVIATKLNRPWTSVQPEVRAALLGSAAQMFLLDRIPDHAIIDEGVEWAKRATRGAAGAFVNAILHRVSEMRGELVPSMSVADWSARRDALPRDDGSAWILKESVFSEEELPRLCSQTSIPKLLIERWRSRLGRERALEIAAASLARPPITLTGIEPSISALALQSGSMLSHARAGYFVSQCSREELDRVTQSSRYARAQDPASGEAVESSRGLPVTVALDACAGRGTKSIQLAEVHPNAKILAFEPDSERRRDLGALAGRLGNDRFEMLHPSSLAEWEGKVDLLLLDVPCTNTAVLSRRVEARHRFSEKSLKSVVQLQEQIAGQFLPLLARDGAIIWSTCSLEDEEDSRSARRVATEAGRKVISESLTCPSGVPGSDPCSMNTGSYHALIR